MSQPEDYVSLGSLRITRKRLEELDGTRVVVAVNLQDVTGARAAWTRCSERPIPQLALAALCIAIGLYSIYGTLLWLMWGGARSKFVISCALVLPLGIYLGLDAIRRGPILLLETRKGTRRLSFGRNIGREKVRLFVDESNRVLGYPIEVDPSLNWRRL